ncbi:RidA family protein [Cryobacterium psychrophilum]|uniref:RidA family protein n=1 Tax=Cryobacterium psychrophilum TaxID=41988 RepID=A0A4Y8KSP6_9MICO|nr:RidA family protein [Cryobacterium psychrophilum]TDW29744.1 enamine deaminase RidA (YjgF/YER057c/UK114 family) [Cryobacterium psychrophilum]TFD81847.1 RidA family protein [Cryobacterium psychrophilum]
MTVTRINTASVHRNVAFAQGTLVDPGRRLMFIGGQNGVDIQGAIVGPDTLSQARQALRNLLAVLAEVGATQENVAKLTVHLTENADLSQMFAAAETEWGQHPTAITVLRVAGLANPEFLVEIDAVAAL